MVWGISRVERSLRDVAEYLTNNQYTPVWFKDIEYINWDGAKKDLKFISEIKPYEAILVDDYGFFIVEDQKEQWIEINDFDYRFPQNDCELERIEKILLTKLNGA